MACASIPALIVAATKASGRVILQRTQAKFITNGCLTKRVNVIGCVIKKETKVKKDIYLPNGLELFFKTPQMLS